MILQQKFRTFSFLYMQFRRNSNWTSNVMDFLTPGKKQQIRQIGDPVLRSQAKPVERAALITPEFKEIVDEMLAAMKRKNGTGIAAPQIGVSLQIIAVEVTGHDLNKAIKKYGSKGVSKMQMTLFPLKVLVNPKIRIIDPMNVTFKECCLSMENFSAMVPRAKEIELEALNTDGEIINFHAIGWNARILQHEIDHLNGNLLIDSMMYKTLSNEKWKSYR